MPVYKQVGYLTPSLTAIVYSLREDLGTSIESVRNVSGKLTGTNNIGYLVLRLVVVIAIKAEIVYKDSNKILINFIKGI